MNQFKKIHALAVIPFLLLAACGEKKQKKLQRVLLVK